MYELFSLWNFLLKTIINYLWMYSDCPYSKIKKMCTMIKSKYILKLHQTLFHSDITLETTLTWSVDVFGMSSNSYKLSPQRDNLYKYWCIKVSKIPILKVNVNTTRKTISFELWSWHLNMLNFLLNNAMYYIILANLVLLQEYILIV